MARGLWGLAMTHDWATDKALDLISYSQRYSHTQAVEMIAAELRTVRMRGEIDEMQREVGRGSRALPPEATA